MNYADIAAAFRDQIRTAVGPSATVVFENTPPVTPPRPYYKAFLLPGENETPTFGTDKRVRAVGIYQVNVVVDAGVGDGLAASLADEIMSAFYRGLTFVAGAAIITIEKSWRSAGIPSGDHYSIPVSVRYWADLT